jgi:putative FmdB family regulatory protein
MPLFEFRCRSCHTQFERLCRNSNAEGVRCPNCLAESPDRLMSSFAVNRNVNQCGSAPSEQAAGCGFNPVTGGCGRCAH